EDGIRDRNVTGVQPCAVPISWTRGPPAPGRSTGGSPPGLTLPSERSSASSGPAAIRVSIVPEPAGLVSTQAVFDGAPSSPFVPRSEDRRAGRPAARAQRRLPR